MGKAKAKTVTKYEYDHNWPKQRSQNIEEMINKVKKSDDYTLELSYGFLHDYSNFIYKNGDYNFAILLSMLGNRIHSIRKRLQEPARKKTRRR